MKKVLIAMVALMMAVGLTMAADETAVAAKVVTGQVVVTAAEGGAVTAVKIVVAEGNEVAVALDDNGKKLAELKGKKVEATGVMKDTLLVVASFKAVEEAAK